MVRVCRKCRKETLGVCRKCQKETLGVWKKVPERYSRSLEKGAGKRRSEFGGRCRKEMEEGDGKRRSEREPTSVTCTPEHAGCYDSGFTSPMQLVGRKAEII